MSLTGASSGIRQLRRAQCHGVAADSSTSPRALASSPDQTAFGDLFDRFLRHLTPAGDVILEALIGVVNASEAAMCPL